MPLPHPGDEAGDEEGDGAFGTAEEGLLVAFAEEAVCEVGRGGLLVLTAGAVGLRGAVVGVWVGGGVVDLALLRLLLLLLSMSRPLPSSIFSPGSSSSSCCCR